MGVMGCSRVGCEHTLCEHHVELGPDSFFYICDSCLHELHLLAKAIPMGTNRQAVHSFVRDFFTTGNPSGIGDIEMPQEEFDTLIGLDGG
jgi:hypothetical protein